MKKLETYVVSENKRLTADICKMVLRGDGSWVHHPGQFINIECKDLYLKRPISICEYGEDYLVIVYRVVGKGTEWMSTLSAGESIRALTDLGNGFESMKSDKALVIGGGVGIPPLYGLTKELVKQGKDVTVILGYRSKDDVFLYEEFRKLGIKVYGTSDDGSFERKGTVVDVMKEENLTDIPYYTCGPLGMIRGIVNVSDASGLVSLEARMGCGFGACMGCSIETKHGNKRVCKEGPVFLSEDVVWND